MMILTILLILLIEVLISQIPQNVIFNLCVIDNPEQLKLSFHIQCKEKTTEFTYRIIIPDSKEYILKRKKSKGKNILFPFGNRFENYT